MALKFQASVYLQRVNQRVWSVHVCSPLEPSVHGLYHHRFPLILADKLGPLSQPRSWAEQLMKFLFRILITDDNLCEPPWRRALLLGKWERSCGLAQLVRQSGVGQDRAGEVILHRSCNPGLRKGKGSLNPFLCLLTVLPKPFKEQHIKGRLLKIVIVFKDTFQCLI